MTRPKRAADLAELERCRDLLVKMKAERTATERKRDALIRRLRKDGVAVSELARAAGVEGSRISQITSRSAPKVKPAAAVPGPRAAEPAAEVEAALVVEDVPRGRPGEQVPAQAPVALLSDRATRRQRRHYSHRTTAWVDPVSGGMATDDGRTGRLGDSSSRDLSLADVLRLLPLDIGRVYLVGARPGDGSADSCRAWFLDPGTEWSTSSSYLADADLPVGRYKLGERQVEVHRAASWFGSSDMTVTEARDAMALVALVLAETFGRGEWMSTPTTTGRDLWLRSIGGDREWQVMSDELRELIAATAGQGRTELLAPPAQRPLGDGLPGFAYVDGRFMYAGLTWGMPVAPVAWHTRAEVAGWADAWLEKMLRGRGRWQIRASVPAGWSHVGLLMAPAGISGWEYPAEPGRTVLTWADGAEVLLAVQQGWPLEILAGVTWAEGKPLNTWAANLVAARERLVTRFADRPEHVRALARAALRSVLLNTIGGFAQRQHDVYRTARVEQITTGEVTPPAGAFIRNVAPGVLSWTEPGQRNAYSDELAHPEWSATVWARARVRLLSAPGGAGALSLPREDVVAFRTDALYLTRDPGWDDDGRPGRFRVKGKVLDGPRPWPGTWQELFALRDEAEAGR